MSLSISAPVLWDGNGTFLDGATVGIQADAIVVGYVMKPSGPSIPNQPLPGSIPVQCLQLKDRRYGTLYTTWTLAQWQGAANIIHASPTTEGQYSVTITGSPVSFIAATELFNAVIDLVSVSGTVQDPATYLYSQTATEGVITFSDPISPTAVITVLFHSA